MADVMTDFVQMANFRLMSLRSALELEVKTGMRVSSRVNTAELVRKSIGSKTRGKAKLLGEFEAHLYKAGLIGLDQFTR
jgi:hypothetical protein